MKKKTVQLLLAGCCVGMLAGCGQVGQKQNNPSKQQTTQVQQTEENKNKEDKKEVEENIENAKDDEREEKKSIAGAISEKKDFMVTLEDESKKAYAIAFDEKPEGYGDLKVGDYVQVEYTGELSETEAFTGKVLSIKKVEQKEQKDEVKKKTNSI